MFLNDKALQVHFPIGSEVIDSLEAVILEVALLTEPQNGPSMTFKDSDSTDREGIFRALAGRL